MRYFRVLMVLMVSGTATLWSQPLSVIHLTCEYQRNPLGIDAAKPRLSWQIVSGERNVKQSAYEIRVGLDSGQIAIGRNLLWESGKVGSDQSILVEYAGPPPESSRRYVWQVRVWDNRGGRSDWSEVASWEMGLLRPGDWKAHWIESGSPGDSVGEPPPMMRRTFELTKPVAAARLYITSHGLYEAHLNGRRVGDECMMPGWTSYRKRLQYQVYDVGSLLHAGKNAAGVMLADGWYRSPLAWGDNKNRYGRDVALLFQLDVRFVDGTSEIIASDGRWTTSTGPIRRAQIYYGEAYDARQEKAGWTQPDYNDSSWTHVRESSFPLSHLVATSGPPARRHERFTPVKIFRSPKGELLVDFGQNLVGWVNLTVRGHAGEEVLIHHAEVLDKQGNFYTDNLRAARQEVRYTLKGGEEETYEPRFSYFGFRYVKVDGYPGDLSADKISAVAVYADMQPSGSFSCSDSLLNRLQHNIVWGEKGNFLAVPTDCPQRDERLGWTGDAEVFSRTAAFNMNTATFFENWLKDLAADQDSTGSVPYVIPNVMGGREGSTGWADAATIIPWTMYRVYGDKRVLEQQYGSMKSWVGYMEANSKNGLWNTGFHFGDWCYYRPPDDNDGRSAVTDKYLIAQSFFAFSTQLLIHAASLLGKEEDVRHYSTLLKRVKNAYVNEYLTPGGRLVSGTQTAYALALEFDLLPENMRAGAAARLARNVREYHNHLTTGFIGASHLCPALTRFGYTDLAYDILLQTDYPSWLYPVTMGATTIWERWDGIKPDSTFQTPGMNSFNHYAYGAIGQWMYSVIGGVSEESPGFKVIRVAPEPGGKLTWTSVSYESPYGVIASRWEFVNGRFVLDLTVPCNTEARVLLPHSSGALVTENGNKLLNSAKGKHVSQTRRRDLQLSVGSGVYRFEYEWK
jgi:alpha-L-rhamnosidase